ncbi:MAG: hypothetical protein R3F37_09470 [Candidatus Competibacteraceae bacterium]
MAQCKRVPGNPSHGSGWITTAFSTIPNRPRVLRLPCSELAPMREYAFFHATQTAFYAQGDDVTQEQVLINLAVGAGWMRLSFNVVTGRKRR